MQTTKSVLGAIWILTATLLFFSPSLADGTWTPDVQVIAALELKIRTPARAPTPIRPLR